MFSRYSSLLFLTAAVLCCGLDCVGLFGIEGYAAPAGARNPALGDAVVPIEDHPYELLHVLEREQVLGMLPAVGGWIGLR